MTTRERAHKLLDELPEAEIEPVLDFIASRRVDGDVEDWGDLEAFNAALTADNLRRLDEEERDAGLPPWQP